MNGSARAQSEVIGTVLLLGLTIAVVGSTVALGSVALADSQQTADLQRVEGAMTQLDSKASLVAHGESPSQRLQLDLDRTADLRVDDEAGWMRIEVETDDGTTNETVPLGAVVYENGDDTVAYQGGGVWRSNGDGVRMVSPPEFHYRGSGGAETLTLPLVTITDSGGALQDTVSITETGRTNRLFPTENLSNPLLGGNVTITVQSEYAEAWGRFFETRTSATVTDLGDNRVEVKLRTRTVHPTVSSSVSATGSSKLALGEVTNLYADSYDSSDGSYSETNVHDGARIQTNDKFHLNAKGGRGDPDSITIRGDLVATSFNPSRDSNVWQDSTNISGDLITSDGSTALNPVSGAITARTNEVRDAAGQNENGFKLEDNSTRTIDSDTTFTSSIDVSDDTVLRIENGATVRVRGGLNVSGTGKVVFDSSADDVRVLVEDGLTLQNKGAIRSVGGNRNELHVGEKMHLQSQASITTDKNTRLELYNTGTINIDNRARITADDDVAGNLWLYSGPNQITINGNEGNGIEFAGVLYAPESSVTLTNNMTFKGSFTSDSFGFNDADLSLHYDESLQYLRPFDGESVPVVSHLHVSTHGVAVSSE